MAVISPYSKQVQCIRTELSNRNHMTRYHVNAQNVQVGTVDSFQGQETDIVIFSAVRSNPTKELGFLRDPRRLNVAITRAKRGLILVGDPTVLRTCRHWAALLDSCERRGLCLNAKDFTDPERTGTHKSVSLSNMSNDSTVLEKDEEEVQDLLQTSSGELYGLFPPSTED
jgi:superfamily I DNA and/or RNA helicase